MRKSLDKIFLLFSFKNPGMWFVLFSVIFISLRWKNLYLLPWLDEFSYLDSSLLDYKWSFFLPWNYYPEHFMGHPVLQPLFLYITSSLFDLEVFIARATSLGFSFLCLFSLYKMTEALFKDKVTACFSVLLTMFVPLFWFHSILVLAHIPLMAFGFGTIYAFINKKYKTLLLFSLGLGAIRESAAAFFLPLVFHGILIPSQRRNVLYMIPSLLLFFSHFFIFFIRTGYWFAHPYTYGGLPHNPNPVFLNFSFFFERSLLFSNRFFHQFPLLFWGLLLLSLGVVISSKLKRKNSLNNLFLQWKRAEKGHFLKIWLVLRHLSENKTFIPLSVSVLFFLFWISYPDYAFRNFFPVIVIFIPLSIHFILKTIPFLSYIGLAAICSSLFFQNVFQSTNSFWTALGVGVEESGSQMERNHEQKTLSARSFVSYLELRYGDKARNLEKWVYMPFPYDQTMKHPLYGYVKNSYAVDHWRFMEKPERYGIVALVRTQISSLPYDEQVYQYLKGSDLFVKTSHPFSQEFILFIHRDMLAFR